MKVKIRVLNVNPFCCATDSRLFVPGLVGKERELTKAQYGEIEKKEYEIEIKEKR